MVTFPIYHMEKEQLTELQHKIKFRMSTHVFHVLFNHFVEYLRIEDLTYSWSIQIIPPDLLHTSGSELIMYMLKSLYRQIGGGNGHDFIEQEHIIISKIIK